MIKRWLMGVVVVFAGATVACAQAARDAEFASIVLGRGYGDVAEWEARRIEADASYDVQVQGDAGYLLARILKLKAAANPERAPELLREQGVLIDELKRKYPAHPMSSVADLEQLQVRLREAEALLNRAAAEEDEALAVVKRAEAVDVFHQVLEQFDGVIAGMAKRLSKDSSDGNMRFKRDLAEYLRANAYYTYGRALEGETERQQAFDKARELFSLFFDDRGEFFNLWVLSFLGRGKAELELARFDDAVSTFSDALEIESPGHPEADVARQLEAFVRDAKAESFYWLLASQVKAQHFAAGVATAKRFAAEFPGAQDTHFGKLFVLEQGRALAGVGDYQGAGEVVFGLLVQSMKSPDVIIGFDIDRYGVSAAKTLAELSAQTAGFFRAPIQYRAGQGFLFKREWERATWALKGVVASASTDDERERWGALALEDMASCYERLNRLEEAALCYQGIYRMFPENVGADRAMRMAKQHFMTLGKADSHYQGLADQVTQDMTEKLSGVGAQKVRYNQAVEWQRQGRYTDAARGFLEIPAEINDRGSSVAVDFHGKALANAGYCYFMAARRAKAEADVQRLREKAQETLKRALAYGEENGDLGAQAGAAYYLALIASTDEVADYEGAVRLLAEFDTTLRQQAAYADKAFGQLAYSLIKLKRFDEAAGRLRMLVEAYPRSEEAILPAFYLGDGYVREAEAALGKGEYRAGSELLGRAGEWLHLWLSKSPKATFQQRAWVGDVLYRAHRYEAALDVLTHALTQLGDKTLPEALVKGFVREYAHIEAADCWLKKGKFAKAVEHLNLASDGFEAASDEANADFLYARTRSDALYRQWVERKDEGLIAELKVAHENYWRVLESTGEEGLEKLRKAYNLGAESFYVQRKRADYRLLEILLGLREWGMVNSQVQQMVELQALADVVVTDNGSVTGLVVSEDGDAVVVQVGGEQRRVPRATIQRIERFPTALREQFLALQERARSEGKLK